MRDRDWTERLRDRLDEVDDRPAPEESEAIWAGVVQGVRQQRRRRALLAWILLPTSIAAALLVALWWLQRPEEPLTVTPDTPLVAVVENEEQEVSVEEEEREVAPREQPRPSAPTRRASKRISTKPLKAAEMPTLDIWERSITPPVLAIRREPEALPAVTDPFSPLEEPLRPVKESKLGLSLLASNFTGSSRSYQGIGAHFASAEPMTLMASPTCGEATAADCLGEQRMRMFNQGAETEMTIRHSPALQLGLRLSYRLTPRLALETGLLYSRREVEIRYGSEKYYTTEGYTRHGVAIPLALRVDLLSYRSLSLYGAGGVQLEKGLSTSSVRGYSVNGERATEQSRPQPSTPLEWGARLGLGLRYRITPHSELFVEPGVTRRFTDSPLPAFDRDRYLLDTALGLTYTF